MATSPDPLLHEALSDPPPPPRRGVGAVAFAVLGVFVIVIAVVGIALARSQQRQPTEGAAPDFALPTLDGGTFRLSEQRGKVVVLNFWASWCAPCREEAPALERMWREYSARYPDRIVFFGVSHADAPSDSQGFIDRYAITYPNAADTRGEVTGRLYRITGVPETFVIDADGQVVRFFFAAVTEAQLRPVLDGLLTEAS